MVPKGGLTLAEVQHVLLCCADISMGLNIPHTPVHIWYSMREQQGMKNNATGLEERIRQLWQVQSMGVLLRWSRDPESSAGHCEVFKRTSNGGSCYIDYQAIKAKHSQQAHPEKAVIVGFFAFVSHNVAYQLVHDGLAEQ